MVTTVASALCELASYNNRQAVTHNSLSLPSITNPDMDWVKLEIVTIKFGE
jgi:hypothetical protein